MAVAPKSTQGNYSVTVTAKDTDSQTVSDTFSLTVVYSNPAPKLISQIPNQTLTVGQSYEFDISSYFSDDGPLTFAASGLPTGLSINSNTGLISGIAPKSAQGNYSITVTAEDTDSQTVSDTFTMTVVVENSPPQISNIPDQVGAVGEFFSFDASQYANDPDGDDLIYSFEREPVWLKQPSSGSPILQGTPAHGIEDRNIMVTVSDSQTSVSKNFLFNVPEVDEPDDDDSDESADP